MKNSKILVTVIVLLSVGFIALFVINMSDTSTHDMSKMNDGSRMKSNFNDADIAFSQGMIPHHEQAIEMAQLAEDRSNNDKVKNLALRIVTAQDPEITQLKQFLNDFNAEQSMGHEMDHSKMMGMASDAELEQLRNNTGVEFDELFIKLMTAHHNGAITMANTVIDGGKNDELKSLAEKIISAQTAEIEEMKTLI